MKAVIIALGVFGAFGCPLALADSSLPPLLGDEAGSVSLLTDAELSTIRGMAAPTGSRYNSKTVNTYTEISYDYDYATGTWTTVEGNTYKTTSKTNQSYKTKIVK